MCNDIRGCLHRLPVRLFQKNVWLLIPLPIVAFLLFAYTSLDLSKAVYTPDSNARQPKSIPVNENALLFVNQMKTFPSVKTLSPKDHGINFNLHNLFRDNEIPVGSKQSKNFTIHVWKHGERMKRRFLRSYGVKVKDPYLHCTVNNCRLSTDDRMVHDSDAVLFHLHQTKGPHTLPNVHPRNQLWIFFTDESPYHTFYATKDYVMKDYNGLFNLSMTYRADSDIPVPYGRTVPLTDMEKKSFKAINYASTKPKGVAILGSNCGGQNHRWEYVKELQNYINVDVYGGCGTRKCPGHFTKDCLLIKDYKFYLAFENSNCREYLTEKLWWNAYHKETVPVVMGASKSDYEKLCPPNSFVHTDDFESPSELAEYLEFLLQNDTAYNSYFEWKREYKVLNEHGYFGSPSLHLCRVCEALNSRDFSKPKIYNDLESFWNVKTDCRKSSWSS